MFDLKYIGHAGWEITKKNFKIICDPWFSPHGAYFGEWKQFPDNSKQISSVLAKDIDVIYISHVHDDHYDPWTLSKIDKQVLVLIPDFRDKTLREKIIELGFKNILELTEKESINIKGVDLKVIPDEGYLDADSCLLLEDGESKILNLNDCHYDFVKLKKITGDVDLLLLQSSNAIWWPCSYDYDDKTKQELGKLKRQNILNRTLQYSQILNAKNVIPNAGPPVLMSDSTRMWNKNRRSEHNPFVLMDDSNHFLKSNGVNSHFIIPGGTATLSGEKLEVFFDTQEAKLIYDNYDSYANIKQDFESKLDVEEIDSVVDKLRKQFKVIKRISKFYVKKIDFLVLFDLGEIGKWILDFSLEEPFVPYTNQKYEYYFILNSSKIALLFKEKSIDFERYFLGCNFVCGRNPDNYNEFLFATLKHFDTKRFLISESLYAEKTNVLEEVFTIIHKGKKLQIQKYCPHMFADLEGIGFIDQNDNFVCPLHGWKFSLDGGGQCIGNKKFCLDINYIEA